MSGPPQGYPGEGEKGVLTSLRCLSDAVVCGCLTPQLHLRLSGAKAADLTVTYASFPRVCTGRSPVLAPLAPLASRLCLTAEKAGLVSFGCTFVLTSSAGLVRHLKPVWKARDSITTPNCFWLRA